MTHHVAIDGGSIFFIQEDLREALANISLRGHKLFSANPSSHMIDYAVWQSSTTSMERQLSYWLEELSSIPPYLNIETGKQRPPVFTHRGGTAPIRVSGAHWEVAKEIAHQANASPVALLIGLWAHLLAGYSQPDHYYMRCDNYHICLS